MKTSALPGPTFTRAPKSSQITTTFESRSVEQAREFCYSKRMGKLLALAPLLCVVACDGSLIFIERFVPFDGVSLAAADDTQTSDASEEDPDTIDRNSIDNALLVASENASVDTSLGFCLSESECTAEPFTVHSAWVRVRNDQTSAEGDPPSTIVFSRYTVRYSRVSNPAQEPFIADYSGFVRAAINPGETVTFPVILVPFETKDRVDDPSQGFALPDSYRAEIELVGDTVELQASATLQFAAINNCPPDTEPVAICPPDIPGQ
ncbi:MAG: hypothetical protein AAF735_02090 [Myxococcota bacterium]